MKDTANLEINKCYLVQNNKTFIIERWEITFITKFCYEIRNHTLNKKEQYILIGNVGINFADKFSHTLIQGY